MKPLWFLADLSPVMVGLVIDRIKARGLEGRITAQQADAQDLSGFQVRKPPVPSSVSSSLLVCVGPQATAPVQVCMAPGARACRSVLRGSGRPGVTPTL